ncbi:Elongator protein 3/MiaB/NifB domain protein [Candidatus Magnetoovum chiemensis]|nr:Elongator protein 3/MiaB/NifB domain protein [Candidatus Magnetoovum chiemensis]
MMINNKRYRLRIIIPAFPFFNIYSSIAKHTTAFGPVCIASSANKLENWDVEVIDENNCRSKFCPLDKDGLPDHLEIQKERPADVVGFYGSLTSTIPRLYHLAKIYQNLNALTIAGGKHIENLPDEALQNNISVVVFGEGEYTIKELLLAWQNNQDIANIQGIAFIKNNAVFKTQPRPLITDFEDLPYPDFGLVRYAKISVYPISRIRGCDMNCEFCAVKDKTRSTKPQRAMELISHLVETRGAREFFESSDHFAANREETIEFCRLLTEYQEKHGIRLYFTVQVRLTDARYPDLLKAMKEAGIYNLAIGYESPIDEELDSMRKGYRSKQMLQWTNEYHKHGFFIHGMFIFGYPYKVQNFNPMPIKERIERFRNFFKQANLDTLQVLLTVPLPGTDLSKRLHQENRLYPLDKIGWQYYDGQFPLFLPDNGESSIELQKAVGSLMRKFYNLQSFLQVSFNILFHFPRIVFPASLSILTFKVRHIVRAFLLWEKRYFRNYKLRVGGYFILSNWFKQSRKTEFAKKLTEVEKLIHKNT